jgi:adenine-specific DNA-methyltransferase
MTSAGKEKDQVEPQDEDPGLDLSWPERRRGRVRVPTPRVLTPVPEASDPTAEDPGNLIIEGDNRQAMVSLIAQYRGQVDVVLIDVPYNTGKNDFRYSDRRFRDPDADDDDGKFVAAEDGGRHTKWLNQMAPTLHLLKQLMADNGVIFIHIDDNELFNLGALMNEIFDESNRVGVLIWKSATDNNPSQISVEHEYILCYAKDRSRVPSSWRGEMNRPRQMLSDEAARLAVEIPDLAERKAAWFAYLKANKKALGSYAANYRHMDDRGPFMTADLSFPGGGGPSFDVLHPDTGKPTRVPPHGYRVSEESMERLRQDGRLHFGKDESSSVLRKRYLNDTDDDPLRSLITDFGGKGVNVDIKRLFPDDPDCFPNPKPVALEEYLLSFVAGPEAIVLDCFAGSGTTGHAVMRLNKRDGGARRFILIEEGNRGDNYATTLTAERIRRARNQEQLPGGFKFYRVDREIDREAFASFQRQAIVDAIRQADASGKGGGIRPVDGTYVIASNRRGQAICLAYQGPDEGEVTAENLRAMFIEAKDLGLAKPLRVYGTTCEVVENDGFDFFQLPDELLTNLSVGRGGGA